LSMSIHIDDDGTTTRSLDTHRDTAIEVRTDDRSAIIRITAHGLYRTATARLTPDHAERLARLLLDAAAAART